MESDKLNELAEFVLKTLNEGKDFVAEQAPLVMQELLTWKAWQHGLTVILLIIGAVAMFWGGKLLLNASFKTTEPEPGALGVCSLVGGATCCGFCVWQVFCLVQVLVAPRVYLIEWAMLHMGK